MDIATRWSENSTCSRLSVGAVAATHDGVILASGYNGAPAGLPACIHDCDCGHEFEPNPDWFHSNECGLLQPCNIAVHAEANLIAYAARQGSRLQDSIVVSTHSPCVACANLMIQCGVSTVYYGNAYRDKRGVEMLVAANVKSLLLYDGWRAR